MSRASTALIATPVKAVGALLPSASKPATPTTEVPPSPGTFRHPRITEIINRQSAASLTGRKIRGAALNVVAIVITFVLSNLLHKIINRTLSTLSVPSTTFDASIVLLLLRLLFVANALLCLRPVLPYISSKDDLQDIPLTPSQRALLGLPASDRPSSIPTAGGPGYITPPRYRRDGGTNTPTSLQNTPQPFSTGRRSISANYSSSPLSTSRHMLGFSPSPQQSQNYRRSSESPFAVSNDFHQSTYTTVGGRGNFGSSTANFSGGLGRSQSVRERKAAIDNDIAPGTPSPSGPKRQPGINYKWLYDKGAKLPRSESTGF